DQAYPVAHHELAVDGDRRAPPETHPRPHALGAMQVEAGGQGGAGVSGQAQSVPTAHDTPPLSAPFTAGPGAPPRARRVTSRNSSGPSAAAAARQYRRLASRLHAGFVSRVRWIARGEVNARSEEHTSELQSRENLVCR